jgi:type II secretory pathway pseudopilin PulG
LLEVLVALAIVSLLSALIFTSLSYFTQSADQILCANNLRGIATAGLQFANDHDGRFTSSNWINHTNQVDAEERLRPGLREYLEIMERTVGVDTIFTCPTHQKTHNTKGFAFNHTYALNSNAANNPSTSDDGTFYYPDKQIRYIHIPHPEQMMYFMDGIPSSQDHRGYYYSSTISASSALSSTFPHHGKNNLVYLSGQVDQISREQLAAIPTNHRFWHGGSK